jgi:putative SOS response-associated peptidase YedK
MARPDTKHLQSQTLSELLNLQSDLFDLTIDYARFIDERAQPPIPFDEMMSTWESVQTAIETIAILTQERDQKLAPETEKKPSRVKKDYDR